MERLRRALLLLTSAVLFPLTLPSPLFTYGNAILGSLALVPLYLFVIQTEETRELIRGGALFGTISTLIANFWLAFFQDFSVWTLGGTTLGYLVYNAILFGFLGLIRGRSRAYRPFLFAMVWVGYEYLKSVGFLGYPWGLAAYTYSAHPILLQISEVTGVWGITAAVLVVNATLGEGLISLLQRDRYWALRLFAIAAAVPVLLAAYGLYAFSRSHPVERKVGLLLIQQNVDSWAPGNFEAALEKAQRLSDKGLEEAPAEVDLVVWSETSLRRPYESWRGFYGQTPAGRPFAQFLSEIDTPLLTGAPLPTETGHMNGALLIAPDGSVLGRYGKQQLVPFAERVPFWELDSVSSFFRRYIGLQAVWVPGSSPAPLEVPVKDGEPLPLGAPICFEDAFSGVVRKMVLAGARGLVNLTNNSWSRNESAQVQHLAAARFRSIEYRIALARSTNSGVTTLVDIFGRETRSLPMFEAGFLHVRLPIYEEVGRTPYTYLGPWLPYLALLGTALLLLFVRLRE
ncbi:MAG: apolipoprotein N-acyltransferase [Alkalispirochaetaceae bacterium]